MSDPDSRTIRMVRAVIVTSALGVCVYTVYTVLVVISVNGILSEAGLPLARSNRWVAQTSLGAVFGLFAAFLARRSAYRPGVLTLAGFMMAQGFATGYLNSLGFAGVPAEQWYWARALVNWMAYSMALRTTQMFPRTIGRGEDHGRLSRVVSHTVGPGRVWVVSAVLLGVSLWLRSDLAFQLGQ